MSAPYTEAESTEDGIIRDVLLGHGIPVLEAGIEIRARWALGVWGRGCGHGVS